MRHSLLGPVVLASAISVAALSAQSAGVLPVQATGDLVDTSQKIITAIDQAELMKNLEYLTDVIGPRLTTSPRLDKANEWAAQRFKDYGLANVRIENWPFGRRWTRGTAQARVLEPSDGLPLIVYSAGFAPSTDGRVKGEVKYVNLKTLADFDQYRGTLKNTIVLLAEPSDVNKRPAWDPYSWQKRLQELDEQHERDRTNPEFAKKQNEFLQGEGVHGVIRDSDKDSGLLNMSAVGGQNPSFAVLPTVFTTHENYLLLWRLIKRGRTVVELDVSNTWSPDVVDAHNVVAEIRGSEHPDEIVLVGAHLDSWDLATGATDNGVNCMAVLETARTLMAMNVKPKRTIRFVLFNGEEQGLLGSRAYVKSHQGDLSKHSVAFIADLGHGPVIGISLHGREKLRPAMAALLAPLNDLGVKEITTNYQGGTDHLPFLEQGVPAFAFQQDLTEYLKTHHSESDTFDKVDAETAKRNTAALAVAAYGAAMMTDLFPRQRAADQVTP